MSNSQVYHNFFPSTVARSLHIFCHKHRRSAVVATAASTLQLPAAKLANQAEATQTRRPDLLTIQSASWTNSLPGQALGKWSCSVYTPLVPLGSPSNCVHAFVLSVTATKSGVQNLKYLCGQNGVIQRFASIVLPAHPGSCSSEKLDQKEGVAEVIQIQ